MGEKLNDENLIRGILEDVADLGEWGNSDYTSDREWGTSNSFGCIYIWRNKDKIMVERMLHMQISTRKKVVNFSLSDPNLHENVQSLAKEFITRIREAKDFIEGWEKTK